MRMGPLVYEIGPSDACYKLCPPFLCCNRSALVSLKRDLSGNQSRNRFPDRFRIGARIVPVWFWTGVSGLVLDRSAQNWQVEAQLDYFFHLFGAVLLNAIKLMATLQNRHNCLKLFSD